MSVSEVYEFGEFALDVFERQLSRRGLRIPLAPKEHDVLVALLRHAGRLVTKSELLERVWPESFVEEGILSVHISTLRKTLGDRERQPRYIETVSRSGYRFIGTVTRQSGLDSDNTLRPHVNPEVYELFGQGRSYLLSGSMFELPKAIEAFRAAIQLDPTYAAAHAGMAMAHCSQAGFRMVPPAQAYSEAKAAALRALGMDASCADAQVALGTVLFLSEWDWAGAERSLKRALQLNPNHSEANLVYG
jgi:DNA-binding winged helix-turn-helix (wHTH) protein